MSDPRVTPANERVAATKLRGQVDGVRFVDGAARQVCVPVADLLRAPQGPRDRQVLRGEDVTVYEIHDGWAFVACDRDGYVGYLQETTLSDPEPTTHAVSARHTHIYPEDNFKSPELMALSHGSRVRVLETGARFSRTTAGYIPRRHLTLTGTAQTDPVSIAERFLGTPYLWGGNSGFGIDCSGLVQAACLACGIPCPGDSDMQEKSLGVALAPDVPLRRNDLLFWKGHVAWVADPETLLHANAWHMAVALEPLQQAIERIEAQGDGPVTCRKRLEIEA